MSISRVQQKLWVAALPYTLKFILMVIIDGVGVSVDPVVGVDTGVDIGNDFSIIIGVVIDVPSPNL